MRCARPALLVLLILAGGAAAAPPDEGAGMAGCADPLNFTPAAQRSAACTQVLERPDLPPGRAALARYFRGLAQLDLGKVDLARGDLDAALELDDGLWPARWARTELAMWRRDYRVVVADQTSLIALHPDLPRLYALRGTALDDLGDHDAAAADFTAAIGRATEKMQVGELYQSRAVAFEAAQDFDHALADLDRSIARLGEDAPRLAMRGRLAYLKGDDAAALAALSKIAALKPRDNYYLLWLFLTEMRSGGDASEALRRRAAGIDLAQWPGPIIEVLLGARTPDAVSTPAVPSLWSDADRQAGAQCELAFYRGEVALLQGERAGAAQLFRAALSTGIVEYVEYNAARRELARLSP
jgi:lipoprotein NlpI